MLKKAIITMTITFLLAGFLTAEATKNAEKKIHNKNSASSAVKQRNVPKNRAGQNQGLLKQLRKAYEQKDMDKIGRILDRIEKRQKQLRAGREAQRNNQNAPMNRQFRKNQGPDRMKQQRWQGRGQIRYWQSQRQWQGFAGPMRGRWQRQGRGHGRQWSRLHRDCGRAFAGRPYGRRGHRAMQRNFARQRWGGGNLNRPDTKGGFGQGPVKHFGPGKDEPMQQQRQKARSEWDW